MSIKADDFKPFLKRFAKKIASGISGLVVDFSDLEQWDATIAEGLMDSPDIYLLEFSKSTLNYGKEEVEILLKNIPRKVTLKQLGSEYLGKLIAINGIVCRVVPTRPMIHTAAFQCRKCQKIKYLPQDEPFLQRPDRCGKGCKGRQFRLLEDPTETKYFDVQELAIQEKPEELKAGQAPQLVQLEITKKPLINGVRAGDIVDVVGILRTKPPTATTKKRKWGLFVDVIYIESMTKDPSDIFINPEEEQEIQWKASSDDIIQQIIKSIAPSIYGCEHIKEAIIYQLFGGREKQYADRKVRGNIHVLWIDDPSTAKSQVLVAAKTIAPRGLYVTGGGASGAGLTAAVVKVENELWALEAGAVVLANEGICCIDEIEKMNDDDRARIHEAMAQQTVNIQKASAHYTLPAKTAVLAAGNPTFGRYDHYKTVSENISLPSTIMSRFDLIFIGKGDIPDEERDEAVATHILETPDKFQAPITKELLKKYIALAKRLNPIMTPEASALIKTFYVKMRVLNQETGKGESPIVITARQLEGLIRIAEAHARVRLSNKVEERDAQASIAIMMKSLEQVGIDPETGEFDIDALFGRPKTVRERIGVVMAVLKDNKTHSKEEIVTELEQRGTKMKDIERVLNILMSDGTIHAPQEGYYKRT